MYFSLRVTISYSAACKRLCSWAGSGFETCGFISYSVDSVFDRFLFFVLAITQITNCVPGNDADQFEYIYHGGLKWLVHRMLTDINVSCALCLKLRRTTVRRHSHQQPVMKSRGQRHRWCTTVTLIKCQLVSWQPAGQFPSVTVNQWLQTWLLKGSYVLCFHFPFLVNFR